MLRGEIWRSSTLDPTVGAEIQKTRPGIIVSDNSIGNPAVKGHRAGDGLGRLLRSGSMDGPAGAGIRERLEQTVRCRFVPGKITGPTTLHPAHRESIG